MRTSRLFTSVVATLALMYSSGCSGNQAVRSTAFNCNQPLPPMQYVNQPASYTAGAPVCVDTRGQQVALVKKKKVKVPKGYSYAAPSSYCTAPANHYYLASDPCLAGYTSNYSGYATVPYTGTANLLTNPGYVPAVQSPTYVADPGYGQVAGYAAGSCPPAVAITPGTPYPAGAVAAPPADCRTVYRKGRRARPAKPNLCPPGVQQVAPYQYQYQCPPAPVYAPAPAPVYTPAPAPVYTPPEPIQEPAPPFPTITPAPAPIPEPVVQPVIQPVVQIPEPTQGPIIQPVIQPIVQTPDPVQGPIIQPVIQPIVQSPPNPEPIIQSLVLKTSSEHQGDPQPVVQKVEIQTSTSNVAPEPITQSLVIKPTTTNTEQAPIMQPVIFQPTTQSSVQQPIIQPVVIQPVIQPIIQAPAQQQIMPAVVQAPPPPPPPPVPQWIPPVIQPVIPQYVPPPPVAEPTFATVVPPYAGPTSSGFESGVLGAGYCPPDICPVPNPVLCAPGQNLSECFTLNENQLLNSPQVYVPNAMAPLPISVPPVNVLPSPTAQQYDLGLQAPLPIPTDAGRMIVSRPEVSMPSPIGTADLATPVAPSSEIENALDAMLGSPAPTYLK